MTVGTFCLVKNEVAWIRAHLLSWLPWLDEMVLFDGLSTDGTLDIIKDVRKNHPFGHRITLVEDRDCRDLTDHYQELFNDCLHTLKTDYAIFAHPDMVLDDPGEIANLGAHHAYYTNMRSFAGEPGGELLEIIGRAERWKNIMRLRKPDLGLHYFGHYGTRDEDMYFSQITGKEHRLHQNNKGINDLMAYPYKVADSGIKILHYSDVRPLERRISRMKTCLKNSNYRQEDIENVPLIHPRVTFESNRAIQFIPAEYHPLLREAANV